MSKKSKTRNSFAASHQQADAYPFLEKQGSSYVAVYWEDRSHNSKSSRSFPLSLLLYTPWLLLLSIMSYEIYLQSSGEHESITEHDRTLFFPLLSMQLYPQHPQLLPLLS